MNPFDSTDIAYAKQYKYNGIDDSICKKLFLAKYWDWCMRFIPMNVAPNVITLIGFIVESISFVLSLVLTNGLTKQLPCYGCVINALCLFFYQTLDNLDGRQARRTGMSSPLGQFFDHGCDAITGVSEVIKSAAVFNMGVEDVYFYYAFFTGITFVLTSYEEYVTHKFYLGKFNAPDEGLLILVILYLTIAAFPSIVPTIRPYFLFAYILGQIFTNLLIFIHVIQFCWKEKECRKRAFLAPIPMFISATIICLMKFLFGSTTNSVFFIMATEFILTYNSQTVIISYLVKRAPLRLIDPLTIMLWVASSISFVFKSTSFVQNGYYWMVLCAIVFSTMILTDVRVVIGFTKGLKIPAFHVIPKEEPRSDDSKNKIQPKQKKTSHSVSFRAH
ncbi:CDP-alcohol phosphatidyltransferase family protein [Trichomonas vaginalis G3]|uniref:CDP-alcohol phosphatidyltransferase family protein n=1 Tax=Trichomonas vaginalis (strain ATCC PRA-98 / G3) TaxID=412133 RepID=A2EWT5_TRIV3|nr:CDP-alcohol phosphatidyltransferase class-I family [Trichomonas vaginalis G3]EAY02850.1 CDP-alcohol phosphatidyltransferase family protein [Trichomonas vaginalis G3]KAI5497364.1 CDP-alcohol phosphatidyltransferase class-I family [Trichomonas vaginalis G3]|eukprot:XP_001315073.1 CDP-alcohol phosphatidyltransferase family protein [Trichomonas vaginalis G3]